MSAKTSSAQVAAATSVKRSTILPNG